MGFQKKKKKFDAVCNIPNSIMKMLDVLRLSFSKKKEKEKECLVDVYVKEISHELQMKWMFLMQFIRQPTNVLFK